MHSIPSNSHTCQLGCSLFSFFIVFFCLWVWLLYFTTVSILLISSFVSHYLSSSGLLIFVIVFLIWLRDEGRQTKAKTLPPARHAHQHSLICGFPLLISLSLTRSPHFHILLCLPPFRLSPQLLLNAAQSWFHLSNTVAAWRLQRAEGVVGGVSIPAADWSEWDFCHLLFISL